MLEHGGNLVDSVAKYGIPLEGWLDLSTGINPHHFLIPTIPPSSWQRLPGNNRTLIKAAYAYYDCQSILATAGSQAALQVLPKLRPPCHIAMPRNMYQEHVYAWRSNGHTVTFFETFPDDKILNQVDVILLCNPNNPTGKYYQKKQLLNWYQQLATRGGWLIIDEAFMDMTSGESMSAHAHQEGLFILRSLGKFFGLVGARIGFLFANNATLSAAREILGPWTITGPSEFVATQALLDKPWQENARKKLATSSLQLQQLLNQYSLTPLGKTDLFQFVIAENATTIHQTLAKQGVWTRLFENQSALRFGLPPDTHWHQLETALKSTN